MRHEVSINEAYALVIDVVVGNRIKEKADAWILVLDLVLDYKRHVAERKS